MNSLTAAVLRAYCIYSPVDTAKFWIWRNFFRNPAKTSGLKLVSKARFGGKFELALEDFVPASIYAFGVWEPVTTAYFIKALRRGDTFIDIGANIGYFTVLAARAVGPSGKVHAIEASPKTAAKLKENLKRNNANAVQVHQYAVADKACQLKLYVTDEKNIGASSVLSRSKGTYEVVEGRILEDIVPMEDILGARIIKIDIEGAEWLAVKGFRHLLNQTSPTTEIFFECSKTALESFGVSFDDCLNSFREAGYEPFVIDSEKNQPWSDCQGLAAIRQLTDEDQKYDMLDLVFKKVAR